MPSPAPAVVIVFVKPPLPGRAKTRLAVGLGAEAAVAFYRACAERTIREACSLSSSGCTVVVAYSAPGDGPAIEAWMTDAGLLPHIARLVPQAASDDLGVRMRAALTDALEGGAAAAAVIGSDVPDLDGPAIAAVLAAVSPPPSEAPAADVAFAPSPDGGFYAVAARVARAGMFGGEAGAGSVPWSTPGAADGAARAARAASLAVHSGGGLAALADVDTLEDLRAWRASAPASHPLAAAADAALTAASTHPPPPPPPPPPSTIAVRALLFAAAREAAGGAGEVGLILPAGASAADAVAALLAAHPKLAAVLPACAVAVNCEVVGPAIGGGGGGDGGPAPPSTTASATLRAGDEVALIPPISGG